MEKTHVFNIVVDTGSYDSAMSSVAVCFMDFEQCSRFMQDLQASVCAFVSEYKKQHPKSTLSCAVYDPQAEHPFCVVSVGERVDWRASKAPYAGMAALGVAINQKYALLNMPKEPWAFDGELCFRVEMVPVATW